MGVTRQQNEAGATSEQSGESFYDLLKTIFYALLIALVFRTFFFQPFSIPSGSMKPTLLINDYIFVSKYSYGYSKYSLPFANSLPDLFGGRLLAGTPERGDVIVFRNPQELDKDYVKRMVGLPGDVIDIREGLLFINGVKAPLRPVGDFADRAFEASKSCAKPAPDGGCLVTQYMETLPNGREHPILDIYAATPSRSQGDNDRYIVPPGHYFFMGDNRDNSQDSRFASPGFVPESHLIGRAEIVLLSSEGAFWEFWKWRGDRFFLSVE
ncbi:MAG: signal peptidase I [Pseudomonadota bacterium]